MSLKMKYVRFLFALIMIILASSPPMCQVYLIRPGLATNQFERNQSKIIYLQNVVNRLSCFDRMYVPCKYSCTHTHTDTRYGQFQRRMCIEYAQYHIAHLLGKWSTRHIHTMTRNCGKLAATTNYTQQTYIVQCRKYKRYEPKEHEREPKRREATTKKNRQNTKCCTGKQKSAKEKMSIFQAIFFRAPQSP